MKRRSPYQSLEQRPVETVVAPDSSTASDEPRFLNRDLQWLEFNERVLYQAMDERLPLLSRVRFLSIHANNLDEFFMKRIGGLRRQLDAGLGSTAMDPLPPQERLALLRERLLRLTQLETECFRKQILPALKNANITFANYAELHADEVKWIEGWYRNNVFPILTPLAVDPGHRFPFISNLSVSLGVMLRRPDESDQLFARIKVPQVLPQWVRIGGGSTYRFIALHEIIERNLADLFPGMEISKVLPFRVTRNADIETDDDDDVEDLLESLQKQLRQRRFAPVVRLQIGRKANRKLLAFLCQEMDVGPEDIYETPGLIEYASLSEIADLDIPSLKFPQWTPTIPPRLSQDDDQDIFSAIRRGDILVHHPYESFEHTVERFIEDAAADPNVLGIKQALYRTSGDSPFIPALIRAAESGKQVAVLVEVRARFDEARNIEVARMLENAGVHVAYGVVGLKTHTKISLVVRRENAGLRSYAHISTGNYNSKTALIYEDLGLFTCDPTICEDIIDLFNSITGRGHQPYNRLLVAPHDMKSQFLSMIEAEIVHQKAGRPASIIAKMNQLQDVDVIDALYRASQAGVRIQLIVRGFCTLRPGLPDLSENISVVSIIGRFLEHSRLFHFRNGAEDPLEGRFFIGSADWMYRNLQARVEAACPVDARPLRAQLWHILQTCLADRRQCWDMMPDGRYVLRTPSPDDAPDSPAALGTHQTLMNAALQRHLREMEGIELDG